MSRFRGTSDDGGEESIDISPLIDCVFILLIFFIVTTTFVDETGVEVDKPQAASATQLEKTSIMLALTADGAVVYAKKEIGLAGVRPQVARLLQEDDSIPVIVEADTGATTGQLVRLIDEIKLAGAKTVSLASSRPSG